MGAEREDTDPQPKRVGTEPGLGGTPSAGSAHAPASTVASDGPAAVDFDALHAALGDPLDFDELPPAALEINGDGSDDLLDDLDDTAERVGESSGRSSATYSSARPHTIPPSYSPMEDLNAPPVIVASEDTVPSAPPQMTVPVGRAHGPIGHTPLSGVPFVSGPAAGAAPPSNRLGAGRPPSGPQHLGHPSPGPLPTPPYPHEAQAYAARGGAAQMTIRMPDRPINPRRAKTPTLLVRSRGPSAKQKLIAFMAMLLLVTACGIAVIIWRKPRWLGLDPTVPLTPTTSAPAATPAPAETAIANAAPAMASSERASASASAGASASAAPTASVSPPVRVIRPRPPPPATPAAPPPPHPSAGR